MTNWLRQSKKCEVAKTLKFRLAFDFRLLPAKIKRSSYSLPKIYTSISNLVSFKYFTSINLSSEYRQIHLPGKYQDIVSLTTPAISAVLLEKHNDDFFPVSNFSKSVKNTGNIILS